ncbi:MAG: PilZ domain-containing protein [Variibacter sp.]|nr:PilZ domain-containing protein [Variibacter sp.]
MCKGGSMPTEQDLFESAELIAYSKRRDVRVVMNAPGRYTLSTRRDSVGVLREFACRALNMSPTGVYLSAAILGPVGDRVVAHITNFGKVTGRIAHVARDGFGVQFQLSSKERTALTGKLLWYERYRKAEVVDQREHGRTIPKTPLSALTLADGRRLSCFVIDVSPSGIAVSADLVPEIGMIMAVGSLIGRVVRVFPEGFALKFVEEQERGALERRLQANFEAEPPPHTPAPLDRIEL